MFREPAAPPLPERGQEGVHVVDISNPLDPVVVAFVDTPCGSHTATAVPDLANNRVLIYNSPSANTIVRSGPATRRQPVECRGVDILEVPLANPSAASYLRQLPSGDPAEPIEERHACHDTGVILGDAMKMACAGGDAMSIFTIDPAEGGSLDNPKFMHHVEFPGVGDRPHGRVQRRTAKYVIFGHEPGGGSQAQCQATSSVVEPHDLLRRRRGRARWSGSLRPSAAADERARTAPGTTYNVVPTNKGRFLVSGNYQSGDQRRSTSRTRRRRRRSRTPTRRRSIDPNPPTGIELGGDWSSYWYNGYVYESDITRGLLVWDHESAADLAARQASEQAAFDAAQAAAAAAFAAQQATAKAAFLADLAVREAACRQIADRLEQKRCLQALNHERQAFESAQKQALQRLQDRTSGPRRPPSSRSRRATARTGG